MSFYKSMMAGIDPLLNGVVFEEDGGGGGGDFGEDGFNSEGFNAEGFNADGYNGEGFNSDGYNSDGLDSSGKAKGGDGGDGWRDGITDTDHRAIADRFNSPADAIKSIADLRKLQSTSIRVPGEDAKPEDIAKYHKALGVPDSPEGYELKMPEGVDATDDDKAYQGKLAEIFHKAGISKAAAGKLNELHNELAAEAEEAQEAEDKRFVAETEAALTKKWGKDMERNKNLAGRFAKFAFGSNFEAAGKMELANGRFLLDDPIMMEMMAAGGIEMDEDGFHRMDPEGAEGLKEEYATLSKDIMKAHDAGDHVLAQKLSDKRSVLSHKIHGNKPI